MKKKTIFKCSKCGYETIRWMGRCSECNSWNSFEEIEIDSRGKTPKGKLQSKKRVSPVKLYSVDTDASQRIVTNMDEFNRVLGGGIVKDSVTIVTARPGAGKSTLLLEISDDVANKGYKVLYASGEESETQISNRANRILKRIPEHIWILSDTSMDNVLESIEEIDPDLIIIDSIQTFL